MLDTETICSVGSNSDDSGPPSLQNEFDSLHTVERAAETDTLQQQNQATSPQSDSSPIVPNIPSNGLCQFLVLFHHCNIVLFSEFIYSKGKKMHSSKFLQVVEDGIYL